MRSFAGRLIIASKQTRLALQQVVALDRGQGNRWKRQTPVAALPVCQIKHVLALRDPLPETSSAPRNVMQDGTAP